MMLAPGLLTRIALFSALIYVLSLGTSFFPNVNLIFFIVFSAGFIWGMIPGMLVGMFGMGLWTMFNPYGPAMIPLMAAQVIGSVVSGVIGALWGRKHSRNVKISAGSIILAGFLCTIFYYLPVNFIDAWLFQPFWPRFTTAWIWSLVSVASNMVIFPLLFGVTKYLYLKECSKLHSI